MAKYVSTTRWRDLEDNHLYATGDDYPYDGREISGERIAELSSTQNKAGFALIYPVEVPNEVEPVQKPVIAKKAVKGRKKTV